MPQGLQGQGGALSNVRRLAPGRAGRRRRRTFASPAYASCPHGETAPVPAYMFSLETAARSLKVVPITAPVHSDVEIETAIVALGRETGGGLVVMPDAFMVAHRAPIILAVARNNVPAVYPQSAFARDGIPSTISMA